MCVNLGDDSEKNGVMCVTSHFNSLKFSVAAL